jgi:pantetheine-phosphate adenylyltransferase
VAVTALCPGTFDPVTNGHVDIIERAGQQFDRVVVAVLENPGKDPLFGVEVEAFSGLLVEYARRVGARVIVKGLRAVTDFEYEIQMAQMNQRLGGVETFFMTTAPTWSYLSSSLVREVAGFGGDVRGLVPPMVVERLRDKLGGA